MRTTLATILLSVVSLAAQAGVVPVMEGCPSGTITAYTSQPPTSTLPIVVSSSPTGLPMATLRCQTLASTPLTWYVKYSPDNGSTWNFALIPAYKALVAAATAPPVVVTLPAANLTWTAPTTDTSGKPLAVPLTYNVYRGTSATALTKLTNVSALTYTDPAGSATPTTYYYAVSATCASCTESAESAIVSAVLAAPPLTPANPTNLAIH